MSEIKSLGDILNDMVAGFQTVDPQSLPPYERKLLEDAIAAEEQGNVCRRCGGHGFIGGFKPEPCPVFAADRIAARNARLAETVRSQLPAAQQGFTFASLDKRSNLTSEQHEEYVTACREAQAWVAGGLLDHPWLVLPGGNGIGKTHLMVCMVNFRIEKGDPPATMVNVPQMIAELRSGISSDRFEEMMQSYLASPLLMLDDLGAENETSWVNEQLFRIVNQRYAERTPLVVSTNIDLDQMEPRIASRLHDKGTGLVQVVRLPEVSFR